MKDIMKSVNIKNKEILDILNEFKNIWWDKKETDLKEFHLSCEEHDRKDYISDEYKMKIMSMGTMHDGYPEKLKGYNLKLDIDAPVLRTGLGITQINKDYIRLNEKLQLVLSTKHNSLCTVYPPEGFISWHNNANASAYNLIFTWSENGDGYWKHVDPYTGKEVIVQDVPGWQCKGFYFGAYEDDPNDIVYHMATTNCWRMTVSYIFDRHHKQFWEDIIEEIETE
jgi:hypothetical protein